MQIAVWDTYVKRTNGTLIHFDILAPLEERNNIYSFGKKYLNDIGEPAEHFEAKRCQFCHIEQPTPEIINAIQKHGYFILRMDDILPK